MDTTTLVVDVETAWNEAIMETERQEKLSSLIAELTAMGMSRFVSFKYTNREGETARHTLHLNVHYGKVCRRDLVVLRGVVPVGATEVEAYKQLTESLEDSIAGKNLRYTKIGYYTPYCKGMKRRGSIVYVNAFSISKVVLVPVVYKTVKHSPLTVAKNKFRNLGRLRKFKEFRLDLMQIHGVCLNGKTLELS